MDAHRACRVRSFTVSARRGKLGKFFRLFEPKEVRAEKIRHGMFAKSGRRWKV